MCRSSPSSKGSTAPGATNQWPVFFGSGVNQQLADVAKTAMFVNPMPATCTALLCTYEQHGTFYFADYGHYSAAGSALAVKANWISGSRSIFAAQ